MGIEPTSEVWEARFRQLKTHKLAAILRFSKFSDGFPLEQPESPSVSGVAAFAPSQPEQIEQRERARLAHC